MLLDDLNEPQKQAVVHGAGPMLILAGAGSGKTKALTHRIAYLIEEKKVSPYNILAVTFTNKAAQEMSERVLRLLRPAVIPAKAGIQKNTILDPRVISLGWREPRRKPEDDNSIRLPWLGTFHSICVRILRREANNIGYNRNFTIFDDQDQLSVIKRVMKELEIDPKQFAPQAVQYFISGAKNELIGAKEYKQYSSSPMEEVTGKVYEKYKGYLRQQNAMDFDDLIMQCVILFEQNPKILAKYQEIFKYILIDEYQDTNQAQYIWAKLLAQKHKNIMAIGDDNQSIYSWRGANFRNILNFEKDYKNCKVIKLEQNYRSTKTILAAAGKVIQYNKNKTDKKLWTDNEKGVPITVYEALNEKDESEFICSEINSLVNRIQNTDNSDCAVLYRTNAQSRAVEEAMLRFKIPYKVVGGVRFYERKEIKDIIAYLRLVANPNDMEALTRAISVPSRGIGEKTIAKIRGISNIKIPALPAGRQISKQNQNANDQLPQKAEDFFNMMEEIRAEAMDIDLSDLIMHIAVKTGYKNFLLDGTPEGEGRWENIEELMTVARSISETKDIEEIGRTDLERFLEQVALVQDTDKIDQSNNCVTLMTMHSAKGLEFDVVFIAGVEEGLFPHSRAFLDESEMEEERRLCYVGITRAKQRLYLIYASERNIYGRFQSNPKSRFIENIPEELIDAI